MKIWKDRTEKIEHVVQNENKPSLHHLVKLWMYVFRSAPAMCLLFMGLTVLLSILRPVLAFVWGEYVNKANEAVNSGMYQIFSIASLAVLYCAINFFTDILNRYIYRRETIERLDIVQANRFQESVNSRIYEKLGRMNAEYHEIPSINNLTERVFGFVEDGWNGLNNSIMTPGYFLVGKLISILSIGASLYLIYPWLCLILIIAPIPTLYTAYVGSQLQFRFIKNNTKLKRESDYFQELMLGGAVKEIKTLALFDFFYDKWKKRIDEYTVKEKETCFKKACLDTLNSIITGSTSVVAGIMAIILMTKGVISLGGLTAVMTLISTLIADVSFLFSSMSVFLSKKNEAAMFFDLIDMPEENEGKITVDQIAEVDFRNVFYRYPQTEQYVLKNINISIHKGEKIALVGQNGSGKTTFVKLVSGILSPSCGTVRINGMDDQDVDIQSRFDTVSSVSQETAKYLTFSVSDNVFLGNTQEERNEKCIREALNFAGLEELDGSELLGKETGGTDLSGGQWQKLAIARGYYRNRNFIILDEPTGNLDPLAETEIMTKYMEMTGDKTVIIVTHRISAASLAERILVFDDGQIVEDGTHEKLLARNGKYADLYRTQAKWYN